MGYNGTFLKIIYLVRRQSNREMGRDSERVLPIRWVTPQMSTTAMYVGQVEALSQELHPGLSRG